MNPEVYFQETAVLYNGFSYMTNELAYGDVNIFRRKVILTHPCEIYKTGHLPRGTDIPLGPLKKTGVL